MSFNLKLINCFLITECHGDVGTHTHTRLTALFPGLPVWAGTRKVKPIWILLKLETVSGSGYQLGHMQVCTALQTDNHASTPPLSFLQAGCPSCRPTNSVKALKYVGIKIEINNQLSNCYCYKNRLINGLLFSKHLKNVDVNCCQLYDVFL